MNVTDKLHFETLDRLNRTVIDSAAYFASTNENRSDGHQTAHAILAQLVFWHHQYVEIAAALVQGAAPVLKAGSFERLNQVARSSYASDSMTMLAFDLSCLQKEFDSLLRKLPDWSLNFPIKQDSEPCPLNARLVEIEAHIRQHVLRLRRGQKEA